MSTDAGLAVYWLLQELARLPAGRPFPHRQRRPPGRRRHDRPTVGLVPYGRPEAPPRLDHGEDRPAPNDHTLRVRCFGWFEVERAGQPVHDWRRGKARTLLKFLVGRRQPVARDVVVDRLWPEADAGAARNSLRVALHALRQALGPFPGPDGSPQEYVQFERNHLSLHPEAPLWVDVDEFRRCFDEGFRLERQRHHAAARHQYERAEGLYRDDYLVEDLYEDWTLARREELKDQYLMVVTRLADDCLQRGDAVGCIVRCHKILQKDACREDAYQRLMVCYTQLGQRSQALHWYDVCVRTLRRELDVEPADASRQLRDYVARGQLPHGPAPSLTRGQPDGAARGKGPCSRPIG